MPAPAVLPRRWSIADSIETYDVRAWGGLYFGVSPAGHRPSVTWSTPSAVDGTGAESSSRRSVMRAGPWVVETLGGHRRGPARPGRSSPAYGSAVGARRCLTQFTVRQPPSSRPTAMATMPTAANESRRGGRLRA